MKENGWCRWEAPAVTETLPVLLTRALLCCTSSVNRGGKLITEAAPQKFTSTLSIFTRRPQIKYTDIESLHTL